ncbi:MAG: ribonuclease III [Clostridium sp.]|nr:ribonuclease III [Clostridium sp.]MCM1444680.1 ribonuclease III [Candidatus Amulumruptor caecigallinarius]
MNYKNLNVLSLAYIGDAVYEIYVRKYLLKSNIIKVKQLQEVAINFVSAKKQAEILKKMLEQNFFNEEEIRIIARARNHKGNRHPKNTDIITYKYSTGLEAVIGYLYLEENIFRLNEVMNYILEGLQCIYMEKM